MTLKECAQIGQTTTGGAIKTREVRTHSSLLPSRAASVSSAFLLLLLFTSPVALVQAQTAPNVGPVSGTSGSPIQSKGAESEAPPKGSPGSGSSDASSLPSNDRSSTGFGATTSSASGTSVSPRESSTRPSRSPFGLSYFNRGTVDASIADGPGFASWSVYQYLSLNYRLDRDTRLALRLPMTFQTEGSSNMAGTPRAFTGTHGNLRGVYTTYNLVSGPGSIDWDADWLVDLPTSESSRLQGWHARVKTEWEGTWRRGRFDFSLNLEPEYFFISRTHTERLDERGRFPRVSRDNSRMAASREYVRTTYNVTDTWGPQMELGLEHNWIHAGRGPQPTNEDFARLALGATWSPTRRLGFVAGAENKIDMRDRARGDWQLYRDTETQYYVLTFLTLR